MRIRIDAGLLARYLGHPDAFARAPGELSEELVLPILDIAPFLVSAAEAGETGTGGAGPPVGIGIGRIFQTFLADPAAGANPEFIVPTGRIWRMIVIHGRLTTSVAAGMREVSLFVHPNDATKQFVRGLPALEQAASLGFSYTWAEWATDNQRSDSSVGLATEKIPANMYLIENWRVRLLTNNIQAADQWTQLSALIAEYDAS